jgi:hypothetical protein
MLNEQILKLRSDGGPGLRWTSPERRMRRKKERDLRVG